MVNEQNQVVTLELPEEVPTVAAKGDTTINPNVPITSMTTTITETDTTVLEHFFLMDHLLYPL